MANAAQIELKRELFSDFTQYALDDLVRNRVEGYGCL